MALPLLGSKSDTMSRFISQKRAARAAVWLATNTIVIAALQFQVARVDGVSMAPTLANEDRLIVNRWTYVLSEPRSGDIVALRYPRSPEKLFVKRVIAAAGDVVRIVAGKVYVNDQLLQDDYVAPEFRDQSNWGPQTIPSGEYFVMGDHRNRSSDSRQWGLVPKRLILGRIEARVWPMQYVRIF
jgi:signal peptidase I